MQTAVTLPVAARLLNIISSEIILACILLQAVSIHLQVPRTFRRKSCLKCLSIASAAMDVVKAVETYITRLVSVPSAMKVLLLDTHTVCLFHTCCIDDH